MTTRSPIKRAVKFISLTGLLFALYSIDFVNVTWAETLTTAPAMLLLMALLDTAVLTAAVRRVRFSGWKLVVAIFLLFYGVKTFLVGIEAVYLSDVLSPPMVRGLFVNGFIVAAVVTASAVWLLSRWGEPRPALTSSEDAGLAARNAIRLLSKFLLGGALYLVLFIAGGLLVFTPVATALDPAGAAAYSAGFEPPAWLPLFVVARGALWAMLTLPAIRGLNGRSWANGLLVGLFFAVLMADNLLLPGTIPAPMRAAHFFELFIANILFGFALVRLLGRPHRSQALAPAFGGG